MATTPQGTLICISSYYQTSTNKFFYGLKKNGRPYFTNNGVETPFHSVDTGTDRNEGNVYGIQLNGDNKEYIVAFGANFAYFEIYDFEKGNVYKQEGNIFFGTGFNTFNYASIFKLNNDINYYFIGYIAQQQNTVAKTFFVKRFLFNNINIAQSYPTTIFTTYSSGETLISSCFETDNKYIICFYLNNYNNYIIIVYDHNLNQKATSNLYSTYYDSSTFYKAVHFTGDAGAFLYKDTDKNIAIEFKNYTSGNIKDYFNPNIKVKINNNNYINTLKLCDMIKLKDKKVVLGLVCLDKTELNLFVIHNYLEKKIKIRHYNIKVSNLFNFKITSELNLNIYNEFLTTASTIYDSIDNGAYSICLIFSYANSIDFIIDITNNIVNKTTNPIIKLYEKCKIENNIFGYIFAGIKIYNYTDGLKLLYLVDKIEISKDSIISNETDIELILKNDINIRENSRIEYGMVVMEPEYDIYNLYPIEIDRNYCGGDCEDEKTIFDRQMYYGRVSFCDIVFNLETLSQNCSDDNCLICNRYADNICVHCKYLYIEKNGKKICLGENEFPPTDIPTTIFTTLPTTILTTILTTLPSTIFTTNPTTILTTISTTIDTTIPTTYLSTITSTILKSIPSTYSKAIPKTILATIPSTIISTIPSIILTTIRENIQKVEENININNCTYEELINNKCSNIKININQVLQIKQKLLNNYTKENTIIKTENIIIQLSTIEEQKNSDYPDISNIDLGECETLLKQSNNISMQSSLILFKTDIKTENLSSTYVYYEIYEPINLKKLDLSVCNSAQISISVPITLESDVELLVKSLSGSGYNIFNENDSFYQDICATYTSVNGTDILLSDRKKDIYQNQSMCQIGCEFQNYNSTTKKAKCDCSVANQTIEDVHTDNLFNKKEISLSFYQTLSNSNFRVLKCYKLVFKLSKLVKNIGEILMTILFFIYIVSIIIYFIIGQKKLDKYINSILKMKNKENEKNKNRKIDKNKKKDEDDKLMKLQNNNNLNKVIKNKNKNTTTKNSEKRKIKMKHPNMRKNLKLDNSKKIKKSSKSSKSTKNVLKSLNNKKAPPKKGKMELKNHKKTSDEHLLHKNITHKKSSKNNFNNILINIPVINTSKIKSANEEIGSIYYSKKDKTRNEDKKENAELYIYSNTKRNLNLKTNDFNKGKELDNNKIKNNKNDFKNLNDQELNNLEYVKAIKYDKRTYFQYYWSLLKKKHLLLFTFIPTNDYNLFSVKIALFIISFSLYLTINGFFFNDNTMHKVYIDNGAFNLIYQVPQILYSSIIPAIINIILKQLSLSEKNILALKNEKDLKKAIKNSKKISICLKL